MAYDKGNKSRFKLSDQYQQTAQKIVSFMSPQTIHRSINEFHLNSQFDCFLTDIQ